MNKDLVKNKIDLIIIESMIQSLYTDLDNDFDEEHFIELRQKLADYENERKKLLYFGGNSAITEDRIKEIDDVLRLLLHQPQEFDDVLIRQLISRITVLGKNKIKIDFIGGKSIEQEIR